MNMREYNKKVIFTEGKRQTKKERRESVDERKRETTGLTHDINNNVALTFRIGITDDRSRMKQRFPFSLQSIGYQK